MICMDPINIERDVRHLDSLGVKNLHLDFMDGHAVPRYGVYPEIIRRVADITDMKMDAHLMVSDPEFAIDQLAGVPIETYTFHIDGNENNAMRIIDKIRSVGARPGIVLNHGSSFDATLRLVGAGYIDFVLFMGIHPGVLKQTAKPNYLAYSVKRFIEMGGHTVRTIQADGAVTFDSIPLLLEAGINNFVGGTGTIYNKASTVEENWNKLKLALDV